MSYIAHKVYKKKNHNTLFYRFIAKRRHKLPNNYSDLIDFLKPEILLPNKSKAILLSPLRYTNESNQELQPPRSAFGIFDGYTVRFSNTNIGNSYDYTNISSDNIKAMKLLSQWLINIENYPEMSRL